MIKGVIFDMDGLMFDTERIYAIYWKSISERRGYAMTDDKIVHLCGAQRPYQIKKFVEWFGDDVPAGEIIDECMRSVSDHLAVNPIPFKPGLVELLDALRERDIPIAIGTGTRRVRADDILARAGVLPYIDAVVCGDEVAACKPDPEIFLKAAALIGVPPQDCVVLEDSFNGIIAAHAAGAQPIMIPDGAQPTDEIRALCAHVFERLDEVIDLL